MNMFKKLEKNFQEEVQDILILTNEKVMGASVVDDMLNPSLKFAASIDLQTGEFSNEKGLLEWLIPNVPDREVLWGYDFEQFEIYHVKARKRVPVKLEAYMSPTVNNCYMLVEVVNDGLSDPRLDELKSKLSAPVEINDELLGKFILERQFSWFSGNIDWLGNGCVVYLETDEEDGDTSEKAFNILKELYKDLEKWDNKFRTFAAEQLTELANDWLDGTYDDESNYSEPEEITEEDFARRISIDELTVYPDGDLTLYYNDDDMFYGHVIAIDANINGELKSADIEG